MSEDSEICFRLINVRTNIKRLFTTIQYRRLLLSGVILLAGWAVPFAHAQDKVVQDEATPKFKRVSPQFIAALGDPDANSGSGAETWGLWPVDPGPRGVWLKLFPVLRATGGFAPAGWRFDDKDWWLDENGLIMDKPDFPLAAGKYLVTGEREVTTMLTVHTPDAVGDQRWELADNASLYDVTHLACRSARYTHATVDQTCTPANADRSLFKIQPGSDMPTIEGCARQDYSVLIIIGVAAESSS